MPRLALFGLACVAATAQRIAPHQVFQHRESGNATQHVIIVPAQDLIESRVVEIAREYSRSHPKNRLLQLVIAASAEDAGSLVRGRGSTEWDYIGWKHSYSNQAPKIFPAAEFLRFGTREGIRLALPGGGAKYITLSNASPFEVQTSRGVAHVRYVSFALAGLSKAPLPYYRVIVFVEAPKGWRAEDAGMLASFLRSITRSRLLEFAVESGWTFATHTDYPIRNPFLPLAAPPTLEEFKQTARYYCSAESQACR